MRSHLLTTAISCLFFFSTVACGSGGDSESLTGTTTTTAPAETALVAEVGFIDIGPQPTAANYAGRLFYSFHPAETVPEKAPLIVFFNGGPGRATSGLLMAFGTGPTTMTVEMAIGDPPVRRLRARQCRGRRRAQPFGDFCR